MSAVADIGVAESIARGETNEESQTQMKNEDEKVVKEEVKTDSAVTDQMDLVNTKINEEIRDIKEEKENETINQSAEGKDENSNKDDKGMLLPSQEDNHEEQNDSEQKVDSNEDEVKMNEVEAKEWRKYFLSACRWFDTDQEKFLRADHLQLILQSADREVGS